MTLTTKNFFPPAPDRRERRLTMTVECEAVTAPPKPGFARRGGGGRVQFGEKVRLPLGDATELVLHGKGKIIGGSEKAEWV